MVPPLPLQPPALFIGGEAVRTHRGVFPACAEVANPFPCVSAHYPFNISRFGLRPAKLFLGAWVLGIMVIQHMGLFSIFKRRERGDDPRLHGHWHLARSEDPTMEVGEGVEMQFSPDGKLTCTIKQSGSRQIMNLTYEVQGSEIISNQPSAPAENRTRYAIDEQGQLVLELGGSRSWYRRPSGGAG